MCDLKLVFDYKPFSLKFALKRKLAEQASRVENNTKLAQKQIEELDGQILELVRKKILKEKSLI